MRYSNTRTRSFALTASLLMVAALSAGCQLIVDFNRGLIDSGVVDGSFTDAGDAGSPPVDSGKDSGLFVADAVADVVFSDGNTADAGVDAHLDAGVDATLDAQSDGANDAKEDRFAGDANTDVAHHPDSGHADANADAHLDAPLDAKADGG